MKNHHRLIMATAILFVCFGMAAETQAQKDGGKGNAQVIKRDLEVEGTLWVQDTISIGTGEATGQNATALGGDTLALGDYSHAEGYRTAAEGRGAHAEGLGTGSNAKNLGEIVASGAGSHAEGLALDGEANIASGDGAHAEGGNTVAQGDYSHAAGRNAQALDNNSFVWSDGADVASTAEKQFTVHAENGIRLLGGPIEGDGSKLTNIRVSGFDGMITGDQIEDGTISGAKLEPKTITSASLADEAVSVQQLDVGSVDARYVNQAGDTIDGDLAVNGDLTVQANGSIRLLGGPIEGDGSKLTNIRVSGFDGMITGDQIEDGTISGAKLEPKTITSASLADEAVSVQQLDVGSVDARYVNQAGDTIDGDLAVNGDLTVQANGSIRLLGGPIEGDGSKLTNLSVDSYDGAINGSQIVDGTVPGGKIQADAVTSGHIQNGAVSYDDLDEATVKSRFVDQGGTIAGDLAVNGDLTVQANGSIRLLGGPIEGDGSKLTNLSVDSYDGAINGSQIVDGTVSGVKIQADAVTSGHIQNGAVSYDDLDEATVKSRFVDQGGTIAGDLAVNGDLTVQANGSIRLLGGPIEGDGSKLTNLSVDSYDGAINGSQIVDGTVSGDKIQADAVTSGHIQNGAVSYDDLDEATVKSRFVDQGGTIAGDLAVNGDLTVQANGSIRLLGGPIEGDGSGLTNLPMPKVVIDEDIILNVAPYPAAGFNTINEAIDSLKGRVIGTGSVTIKLADGRYDHPPCEINRLDGNRIFIVGNTANPAACTLRFTGYGIYAGAGFQIGGIAGVMMDGMNREGSSYAIVVSRSGRTLITDCIIQNFGSAIGSLGASSVYAENVVVSNCKRALLVSRNACLDMRNGTIENCDIALFAYLQGVGILQNCKLLGNLQKAVYSSGGTGYEVASSGAMTTMQ